MRFATGHFTECDWGVLGRKEAVPTYAGAQSARPGGPIARCRFFCLNGSIGINSEVRLEPLQAGHAEGMFEGLGDPAGYLFLPGDPPIDLASLRVRYARQIRGHPSDGTEVWLNWVARCPSSGALVGYTQATPRDRVAHVAYHIFPAYRRQGL